VSQFAALVLVRKPVSSAIAVTATMPSTVWITAPADAEIGRRLSRPTSTITREVNRNRGPAGYQADQAQRATRQRARRRGTAPARGLRLTLARTGAIRPR
jgi:hypothetical protein